MSATEDRPDYFVLLGLDPNTPWDQARFERVLAEHRNEWARLAQTGLPRNKAARAKRNLALYKDIGAVMGDSVKRGKEVEKARAHLAAALGEQRDVVDEQLTLMLAKGYLLEEEVTRLRRDHADVLASAPDLVGRIASSEVRQPDSAELRLNPDQEHTLASYLSEVGEISLYDVLKRVDESVTHHSPLEKLLAAAETLREQAHGVKNKTDPTLTTRERLSGLAKVVFVSEEQRRRHDMSMVFARLRAIITRFETALEAAGAVSAAQFELYLEEARTSGVADVDLAKRHFVAHFARRAWTLEMPAAEVEDELRRSVQCPRCAALNDPDSAACRKCRLLLRVPCPNCGAVDPRYGLGCGCGFPIGQRYLVEDLTAQARHAYAARDYAQVELLLDRAAKIWALPDDRADTLTGEIRAARTALDETVAAIHGASEEVERLMNERRYVAAAKLIRSGPGDLPRRDELLAHCEAEVDKARRLCRQAQQPATSRAQRVDLYTRALRGCDDMELARAELDRMPPEPPGNPSATVSDPAAGVLLTWQASPDDDVSYVVVQFTGTRAPEPSDNLPGHRRVGTTTRTTLRDRGAAELPGVPLRYAVFTDRSGTFSSPALLEPVVVAAEPVVDARAEDGEVVLTWNVPSSASHVEVSREEAGGTPTVVGVSEQGRLTDTDVRNGTQYRYSVRAAYPGPSGGLVWSDGRARVVTPTERPAPAGPLTVTGVSQVQGFAVHKAQIRWSPPGRGIMKVIRLRGAGMVREGDRVPEAELHRDGRILEGPPPVVDAWIERDLTTCSYVPVVVVDGMGYIGTPRRYARAEEPADVHAEFVGAGVRLGWMWPEGCTEVVIAYDDQDVLDPTVASGQVFVGRQPGDPTGGCDLPAPPGDHLNVVVAAVVEQGRVRFVTSGIPVRVARPPVRIQYNVRMNGRRGQELVLRAERPVSLPALILRGRPRRTPQTPVDGVHVMTLDPMRLTGRHIESLLRSAESDFRYRLFTLSTADTASVQLDPV